MLSRSIGEEKHLLHDDYEEQMEQAKRISRGQQQRETSKVGKILACNINKQKLNLIISRTEGRH